MIYGFGSRQNSHPETVFLSQKKGLSKIDDNSLDNLEQGSASSMLKSKDFRNTKSFFKAREERASLVFDAVAANGQTVGI